MNDLLTDDDLDVLVEALEAWENKDFGGEVLGDVVTMMLGDRTTPQGKAQVEAERRANRARGAQEKRARKERSILLRAKLITIRNDRRVDTIEAALRTPRQEGP